jgi:hypothetical protein
MAAGVQAADTRDPINRVGKESSSSKSTETYRSVGFRLTSITGLEAEHGQHFPVVPPIPFGRTIAATAGHRLLLMRTSLLHRHYLLLLLMKMLLRRSPMRLGLDQLQEHVQSYWNNT